MRLRGLVARKRRPAAVPSAIPLARVRAVVIAAVVAGAGRGCAKPTPRVTPPADANADGASPDDCPESGVDCTDVAKDAPEDPTPPFVPVAGGTLDGAPVAAFALQQHEVTVSDYARCVDAGACIAPEPMSDDVSCNWGEGGRGTHPINCVDFDHAAAYCAFEEARLPTEREWIWAARGGEEARAFPWGDAAPDPARLNACDSQCVAWGQAHDERRKPLVDASDDHATTAPVGSKPGGRSRDGIDDLAGNVAEWTSTYFDEEEDFLFVVGGGWRSGAAEDFTPEGGDMATSGHRSGAVGIRCARDR